tara:strand:+ start:4517 stop:4819 length:303 start_codon:yes stop_codon:yes gene_type:complete
MTNPELIQHGIAMFKQSCYETSCTKTPNGGITWWNGRTCEGGGSYATHRMNQDTMTPVRVAFEVGHRSAIHEVRRLQAECLNQQQLAVIEIYKQDNENNT